MGVGLLRRRQWGWQHIVLWVLTLGALVGTIAAKGSITRYEVVTRYWFPEYLEWRWDERIVAGLDLAFSHFFYAKNHLTLIFLVLLAVLVFQRVRSPLKRLMGLMPVCLHVLGLWLKPHSSVQGARAWLTEMWSFQRKPAAYEVHGLSDYAMSVNPAFYVHLFLVGVGVLCVAVSLWNCAIQSRYVGGRSTSPLVFGAALCSTIMMGLSPTLYASGDRIFFVQDIAIVFLCALVFSKVRSPIFSAA